MDNSMSRNNEHKILLNVRERIQNNKSIGIFQMFYVDISVISYQGERASLKIEEQIFQWISRSCLPKAPNKLSEISILIEEIAVYCSLEIRVVIGMVAGRQVRGTVVTVLAARVRGIVIITVPLGSPTVVHIIFLIVLEGFVNQNLKTNVQNIMSAHYARNRLVTRSHILFTLLEFDSKDLSFQETSGSVHIVCTGFE